MIRTIHLTLSNALRNATKLFAPSHTAIKHKESMEGAQNAAPINEIKQEDIYGKILKGEIPAELPCFFVIDGKGKPFAACYYLNQE